MMRVITCVSLTVAAGFVVVDVEDGIELGDLEQILDALGDQRIVNFEGRRLLDERAVGIVVRDACPGRIERRDRGCLLDARDGAVVAEAHLDRVVAAAAADGVAVDPLVVTGLLPDLGQRVRRVRLLGGQRGRVIHDLPVARLERDDVGRLHRLDRAVEDGAVRVDALHEQLRRHHLRRRQRFGRRHLRRGGHGRGQREAGQQREGRPSDKGVG